MVDEYVSTTALPGGCGVPRSQQAEITIDGQPGRISECPNRIEATVVAGGRLYLFTLSHDRSDARAVFDAFAATIDLTPETAVDFPGHDDDLRLADQRLLLQVSRQGRARAGHGALGSRQPAARRASTSTTRFDVVETGLGAYFEAASTQIPDGVSIDEWVDEYVSTAGGCGVPRSQQAEITIDGQSGRISECPNRHRGDRRRRRAALSLHPGPDRSDARAWFDAWVATIDLTPETAAVP